MKTVADLREQVIDFARSETNGWRMLIGGQWVESVSKKRFTTYNPSLDVPLADVPDGGEEDISLAVEAAKAPTSLGVNCM